MRLAVGQALSTTNINANVASAVTLVNGAAASGARLVLLSELFLNGYDLDKFLTAPEPLAVDDLRLDDIRNACSANGVSALIGAATVADGEPGEMGVLDNSLLWFGTDGTTKIVYRKSHIWEGERVSFVRGDGGVIVGFDGVTLGLGICYDAGFPEFTRAYAKAGVDVILFSSAFALGDERSRYHIYHAARALESGAFVAVSNALGKLGESEFFGESAIYDPTGIRLVNAESKSRIVVADIDPIAVRDTRSSLTYLNDLLPDYTPRKIDEELI